MPRSNKKKFQKHIAKSHSSQAALEFIMTYGWAILVVLVAVGALAYFGVLKPDLFLPKRCSLPSGFACLDYKVEPFQVVLVLQNSLGNAITLREVNVSSNNLDCINNEQLLLNNDEKAIVTVSQCNNGETGQKFNGKITIKYNIEGQLSHAMIGVITTTVGEGSPTSSQNICQDAETDGLCEGLDIAYGIGYRDACCGEFSLCC